MQPVTNSSTVKDGTSGIIPKLKTCTVWQKKEHLSLSHTRQKPRDDPQDKRGTI